MVYEYLLYDRPEIFWCTGGTQITSYTDYSEVRPVYICLGEELQQQSGTQPLFLQPPVHPDHGNLNNISC